MEGSEEEEEEVKLTVFVLIFSYLCGVLKKKTHEAKWENYEQFSFLYLLNLLVQHKFLSKMLSETFDQFSRFCYLKHNLSHNTHSNAHLLQS